MIVSCVERPSTLLFAATVTFTLLPSKTAVAHEELRRTEAASVAVKVTLPVSALAVKFKFEAMIAIFDGFWYWLPTLSSLLQPKMATARAKTVSMVITFFMMLCLIF